MDKAGRGLVMVTGGVRSGKSSFAEELARDWGGERVVYLATCQAKDEEMRERIRRHRQRRPDGWLTIEEPLSPSLALREQAPGQWPILVDCLALLLSNHLVRNMETDPELDATTVTGLRERILSEVEGLVQIGVAHPAGLIIVSNEVGWGLVPPYISGRVYRDLLGEANSRLANAAERVFLLVAGLPLEIKSWVRTEEEKYE